MQKNNYTDIMEKNHMEIPWHDYARQDGNILIDKAGLIEKASVIGRVGLIMLSCGTGAWRVRTSMNRLSKVLGVTCTVDVGLMSIEFNCFDGTDCMVRGNRQLLTELVENLCQNAIRYNNEGGTVNVTVHKLGGKTVLTVEDNGIGIPKDQQERVFERFYRVDKSRSKETGGTGLGLAIVKHIVELHDAGLTLDSEVGRGTTIKVEF